MSFVKIAVNISSCGHTMQRGIVSTHAILQGYCKSLMRRFPTRTQRVVQCIKQYKSKKRQQKSDQPDSSGPSKLTGKKKKHVSKTTPVCKNTDSSGLTGHDLHADSLEPSSVTEKERLIASIMFRKIKEYNVSMSGKSTGQKQAGIRRPKIVQKKMKKNKKLNEKQTCNNTKNSNKTCTSSTAAKSPLVVLRTLDPNNLLSARPLSHKTWTETLDLVSSTTSDRQNAVPESEPLSPPGVTLSKLIKHLCPKQVRIVLTDCRVAPRTELLPQPPPRAEVGEQFAPTDLLLSPGLPTASPPNASPVTGTSLVPVISKLELSDLDNPARRVGRAIAVAPKQAILTPSIMGASASIVPNKVLYAITYETSVCANVPLARRNSSRMPAVEASVSPRHVSFMLPASTSKCATTTKESSPSPETTSAIALECSPVILPSSPALRQLEKPIDLKSSIHVAGVSLDLPFDLSLSSARKLLVAVPQIVLSDCVREKNVKLQEESVTDHIDKELLKISDVSLQRKQDRKMETGSTDKEVIREKTDTRVQKYFKKKLCIDTDSKQSTAVIQQGKLNRKRRSGDTSERSKIISDIGEKTDTSVQEYSDKKKISSVSSQGSNKTIVRHLEKLNGQMRDATGKCQRLNTEMNQKAKKRKICDEGCTETPQVPEEKATMLADQNCSTANNNTYAGLEKIVIAERPGDTRMCCWMCGKWKRKLAKHLRRRHPSAFLRRREQALSSCDEKTMLVEERTRQCYDTAVLLAQVQQWPISVGALRCLYSEPEWERCKASVLRCASALGFKVLPGKEVWRWKAKDGMDGQDYHFYYDT